MTILALETATDVCGVAVFDGGRLVAELSLRRRRAHAEQLVPMIGQALDLAGKTAPQLDAVAVSAGPGSYTGLRIGASTAKGLALACGAHLVAVPSLEALAAQARPFAAEEDAIVALFSARRTERFAAAYAATEGGLAPLLDAAAVPLDGLATWLADVSDRRLWLVGEGAPAAAPLLTDAGFDPRVLDAEAVAPTAAAVGRQALGRLAAGEIEDVAAFEPFYLKPFVAKTPKQSIFEKLNF